MPGLCGYAHQALSEDALRPIVAAMQQSLIFRPRHMPGSLFSDDHIAAASVALGNCESVTHCHSGDTAIVWCDGERYADAPSDAAFALELYNAYTTDDLLPFLRSIDAVFSAVIYNRRQHRIHFVSDRFGLRQLYLCTTATAVAWSSEIKAFKYLPAPDLKIDPDAVSQFIGNGHFTGNRTWFKEVTLLEPATIDTWDCTSSRMNTTVYWNKNEISQRTPVNDIDQWADELGAAFKRAVKKRCLSGERIGVGLSGGLDSRAIFAALPKSTVPVPAVTFGRPECPDMAIARRVAALRPSHHVLHEITAGNWLNNRLEGIWLTDGQLNMLHMHGIEQIDAYNDVYDIELNGFLGDALLGGSYASHPNGEYQNFLDRGRRFIASGLYLGSLAYHTRLPFFDRELIELTLAIPLSFRRNSALYNRMLLRTFPEYFTEIPWQKTGLPISRTSPLSKAIVFTGKFRGKLRALLPFLTDRRNFFDYASWIRTDPARTLFTDRLTAADAPLFSFVNKIDVRRTLAHHFSGLNRAELLGRYLTVDEWLRRFY